MSAIGIVIPLTLIALVVAAAFWLTRAIVHAAQLTFLVRLVCAVAVAGSALFTGVELFMSFVQNQTSVTALLSGRVPTLTIPDLDGTTAATVLQAGDQTATFLVTGLTLVPRLLLALEGLLKFATVCFFALGLWRLAGNVGRGKPFARLSRTFMGGAALLLASSFAWTLAGGLGNAMATDQALRFRSMAYTGNDPAVVEAMSNGDLSGLGWPIPADTIANFSFAPLAGALILAVIGVAFAAGERMQQDVEGLV